LNILPEDKRVKLLSRLKDSIFDAYAKDKINEIHYSLLKERLGLFEKIKPQK
jgi:hypothetical protein